MSAFATAEDMADALVKQHGLTRDAALKIARVNVASSEPSIPPSVLDAQQQRLEKLEQNDIRKLVITLGGKVWDTSAVTRSKVTPGFADLLLTIPIWAAAIFWETKSLERSKLKHGGRSPEQLDFAEQCELTNQRYGHGTFSHFVRYLENEVVSGPRRVQLTDALQKAGLTSPARMQ